MNSPSSRYPHTDTEIGVSASATLTPDAQRCQDEIIVADDNHGELVQLRCAHVADHPGPHGINLDGKRWAANLQWMKRDG